MKNDVASGALHPMEAKKRLARTITAGFHSEAAAQQADENWAKQFQEGTSPSDLETVDINIQDVAVADAVFLGKAIRNPDLPISLHTAKLLVRLGMRSSRTDAERQVKVGISINDTIVKSVLFEVRSRPAKLIVKVGRQIKIANIITPAFDDPSIRHVIQP
jgi:tyrosyl-tRNA synthetase